MKRICYKVLAIMCVIGCLCVNVGARDVLSDATIIPIEETSQIARATNSFEINLKANGTASGDKNFTMAAGESVRIYATYAPSNASVDFGLIDSNGDFHYVNTKSGSIDTTFEIAENGTYTLGLRNHSGSAVKISGFVKY